MKTPYAIDAAREMIRDRQKGRMDYLSGIQDARDIGVEVGRAVGRQEGREEGRQEGREEGRQETLRHAAMGMISAGLSREQITLSLGISEEQLAEWV